MCLRKNENGKWEMPSAKWQMAFWLFGSDGLTLAAVDLTLPRPGQFSRKGY